MQVVLVLKRAILYACGAIKQYCTQVGLILKRAMSNVGDLAKKQCWTQMVLVNERTLQSNKHALFRPNTVSGSSLVKKYP